MLSDTTTEKDDVLVVVFSRAYSNGLNVIRAFGSAGYKVDLVASAFKAGYSDIMANSKYIRNSVEIITQKLVVNTQDEAEKGDEVDSDDDEESIEDDKTPLIEELLRYKDSPEKVKILFPADDYSVSVADTYRDVLSPIFAIPGIGEGGAGSLTACLGKHVQNQVAARAGLPVPSEWLIPLDLSPITVPGDMIYPCFCKPASSFTGFKWEMRKCNSEEELISHLERLARKNPNRSVVVQEFLNIDQEIDVQGLCFNGEVLVPGVLKKERVAEYEKGVGMTGVVSSVTELGDKLSGIKRMMASFGYNGMFDIDMNRVGDKLYFGEINFRSGGTSAAFLGSGINMPALYAKFVAGEPIAEEEKHIKTFGQHYVYEKIAWDDYGHGYFGREELDEIINSADIRFLYDDEDPVPGIIFDERAEAKAIETLGNVARRHTRRVYSVMRQSGWSFKESESFLQEMNDQGVDERTCVTERLWQNKQDALRGAFERAFEGECDDYVQMVSQNALLDVNREHSLAQSLVEKRATLQEVFDYLDLELPDIFVERADTVVPSVAFKLSQIQPGSVYFCRLEKGAAPKSIARAGAICVISNSRLMDKLNRCSVPVVAKSNLDAYIVELSSQIRRCSEKNVIVSLGQEENASDTDRFKGVLSAAFGQKMFESATSSAYDVYDSMQRLGRRGDVFFQEVGPRSGNCEKIARVANANGLIFRRSAESSAQGKLSVETLFEYAAFDRRAAKDAFCIVDYENESLAKLPFQHRRVSVSVQNPDADYHVANYFISGHNAYFDVEEKSGFSTHMSARLKDADTLWDVVAAFALSVELGGNREQIAGRLRASEQTGLYDNAFAVSGRTVYVDASESELSFNYLLFRLPSLKRRKNRECSLVLDYSESGSIVSNCDSVAQTIADMEGIDNIVLIGAQTTTFAQALEKVGLSYLTISESALLEAWLRERSKGSVVIFKFDEASDVPKVIDQVYGTCLYANSTYAAKMPKKKRGCIKYRLLDECAVAYRTVGSINVISVPSTIEGKAVRLVSSAAFRGTKVRSVALSAPLRGIGRRAFADCEKLKSVWLPNTMQYIGLRAFANCAALTHLLIPEGTETIDIGAFEGCSALQVVYLPASILSLRKGAFDKTFRGTFVVVKDSYAHKRIERMCPQATIVFE